MKALFYTYLSEVSGWHGICITRTIEGSFNKIGDDIFHNYYMKLHENHDMQISSMRESAHRVKTVTDVYFATQLIFALLAGAAVLFYIDSVVLKNTAPPATARTQEAASVPVSRTNNGFTAPVMERFFMLFPPVWQAPL